jgi:hypothetical protein
MADRLALRSLVKALDIIVDHKTSAHNASVDRFGKWAIVQFHPMSCFDHREVVPWALRGTCHGVQILAVGDGRIDGSTKSESSLAKPVASRSGLAPCDFLCHVQQELLVVRSHSSK